MQATQENTAHLNKLLRGEIAATETYIQALARWRRGTRSALLKLRGP